MEKLAVAAEEESAIERAKESQIEEPPEAPKEDFSKSPYPRLCPSSRSEHGEVENFVGKLLLKNIDDVKALIETATANGEFPADVSIWGISLLNDWRSDTVIDKFLLATNGKPKKAMARIRETIKWREELGIDKLIKEDLDAPPEWERAVFITSMDKRGFPVCYNVYEKFKNEKTLGDPEKRWRFLRWRIQFLEKAIRKRLTFRFHHYSTMVQVFDLKGLPRQLIPDLFMFLDILQDHYPALFANQIFINVPSWVFNQEKIISLQRTKKEFVFASQAEAADTLFKYIFPEHVPLQLGGLDEENNPTIFDGACWNGIEPFSQKIIKIPIFKKCRSAWEIKIPGWNVYVGVEFVPSLESSETVTIQRLEKVYLSNYHIFKYEFDFMETGKLIITVDNDTSEKKILIYRYKRIKHSDSTKLKC